MLDIYLVLFLNIISEYLLGAGFSSFDSIVRVLSFLILLPRFIVLLKRDVPSFLLFFAMVLLSVTSSFLNRTITSLGLDFSFLLLFCILLTISRSNFSLNDYKKILKVVLLFSGLSMFLQISHSYLYDGSGQLLRGDRNHSAVIVFSFFCLYLAICKKKSLLTLPILLLNLSRNLFIPLLVGFVFLKNKVFRYVYKNRFIVFFIYIVFLNGISFGYFIALDYFSNSVQIGSANNAARLITIFDGSNALRFKMNVAYLNMVFNSPQDYLLKTGVYSELKNVLTLYPHNSFLHSIERLGIIRAFMYLTFFISIVRSPLAAFILTMLFFQCAFIHEIFFSNVVVLFVFSMAIVNHKFRGKV